MHNRGTAVCFVDAGCMSYERIVSLSRELFSPRDITVEIAFFVAEIAKNFEKKIILLRNLAAFGTTERWRSL